ncbi:MAG TPA: serine acetyltransferase [Candidatus Mediterraneibacter faecavium]|uniref:Serine acetyltransferase n=1 Tax=Candidatus Mediterraneibacter faecavium TaxID=2838668 RepID=A0A9D2TNE4_9FIRM|nr:serine acetyltransferase [Candidatus Mediterraneibacter faecavium]
MNVFWKSAAYLYKHNCNWGGYCFEKISYLLGGNAISAKASIGEGTVFEHRGLGCVVHAKSKIGKNCIIFQSVTIGSRYKNGYWESAMPPVIEDGVIIGAGAVILGNITIGTGAHIGANAVCITDIPAYSTAVGIPAKIVKTRQIE